MPSSLITPYDNLPGTWVRGNLHGHSREHSPCASVPLLEGAARYHKAGARFMAVTDHDHVTDLSALRARYPDMVFLQGFEFSSTENMLFVGQDVPPLYRLPIQNAIAGADGLLTVVCHPRPNNHSLYWTADMIRGLAPQPVGMEVYNGHYSRPLPSAVDTNPLYTDIWDDLLTGGMRLWGFANDDFHDPPDFGKAYTMVAVDELSAEGVLSALKAGRCYASTGLLVDSIGVDGLTVSVRLAAPARGRFIGPEGKVLSEAEGIAFSHRCSTEAYVRFEAEGKKGRVFLQPFFRS